MSIAKTFLLFIILLIASVILHQYDEYIERKKERSSMYIICGRIIDTTNAPLGGEKYFILEKENNEKIRFTKDFTRLKRWTHPKSHYTQQVLLGMQIQDRVCVGYSEKYFEHRVKYQKSSPYIFYVEYDKGYPK